MRQNTPVDAGKQAVAPSFAEHICERLSEARLGPYRDLCSSPQQALALYRWNLRMAGSLHQALSLAEVMLRNAIDTELRAWNSAQPNRSDSRGVIRYDEQWVRTPASPLWALLNPKSADGKYRKSTYKTAHKRATADLNAREAGHRRHGVPVTHDDVVAHITLGTWVNLLPRRNTHALVTGGQKVLWDAAIHRAFPTHSTAPLVVRYWVDRLHRLRNRVAHLEPLVHTDVPSFHRTIARLLNSIDPEAASWYAGTTDVPAVWSGRPITTPSASTRVS